MFKKSCVTYYTVEMHISPKLKGRVLQVFTAFSNACEQVDVKRYHSLRAVVLSVSSMHYCVLSSRL